MRVTVPVPAPRRPGPPRVLYFGRLEHRKGVLTLAEAAHRWLASGATAHIAFIGGDTKWQGRSMRSRLVEVLGPYAGAPTCRFLLVVTVAARHRLDVEVPGNATLTGYVPHPLLLPGLDAVVCTAGQGIVSKALWWGVPLVVAAYDRDQPFVAEAVAAAGCGVRVGWPPAPQELRRALATVLESPEVRARARALSGPQPGHPSPAQVAQAILSLAGPRVPGS